jgi:hypothetical protein
LILLSCESDVSEELIITKLIVTRLDLATLQAYFPDMVTNDNNTC